MRIRPFLLFLSTLLLPMISSSQVVINEFSAANYTDVVDNYNDNSDWIELYNSGPVAVDLSGYYLSDRLDDPMRWAFPAGTSIEAGGYLLVWASGRDESVGGNLHSNFKVSQGKQEDIVFANPSGTVLDSYALTVPNQQDHSRGRVTDGAPQWGIFTTTTPGAANVNAVGEYTDVTIDVEAGYYSGAVSVTVSSSDPNAAIYYTTDGSVPTTASTPYTGPINVTATTVVRARAFNDDPLVPPSFVETSTYFVDVQHVVDVISIAGDELLTLLNGWQIEPIGNFELFSAEGQLLAEAVGDFNEHGNDSWAYDQRGVDYITQDELGYGNELHHQIFENKDRDGYQRLILKAAASDNYPFENGGAHIRDAYVQSLSQLADLRLDERTYRPCVLYVNGEYWGVYEIREKVDDLDFTDHYYDQGMGEVDFLKTWGGTWVEYGSDVAWNDLRDFILGNDMTDPGNYQYVKERYNTGSLIDYFLLNSYVVCSDWLNWNTGWWRGLNPDGDKRKWRYILWDMDAVFGHYANFTGIPDQSANADPCDPEQLGDPGGQGHVPIWNTLIENDEFFADYINRYADLAGTYFSCEFMQAHLDSLVGLIAPEMPAHVQRWGGSMAGWESNVQEIRDFIDERCQIINDGYLDCYPELDGPYNVVFYADPPEGGRIDLPSMEIDTYPHQVSYFGGVQVDLDADENDGFIFSHWTLNNNTLSPDEFSEEITVNFAADDTLIAHFVADVSYPVTLDAQPPNGGTITINGTVYDDFPVTVELSENLEYTATAQPNFGYGFEQWQTDLTLTGPFTDSEAQFVVTEAGNLTAIFYEVVHEVSFDVSPEGAGRIWYDGEVLEDLPQVLSVPEAHTVHLDAEPILEFREFSHWTFLSNTPDPDEETPSVEVDFTAPDVVIANFITLPNYTIHVDVEPEGAGWVWVADTLIKDFPTQKRLLGDRNHPLEAFERGNYAFSHWEVEYGMPITYPERSKVSYPFFAESKVTAHFRERLNAVWVPNAFTPNGDGYNDILKVYGLEVGDQNFRFEIIDRWGGKVWGTDRMDQGWNGTEQGSEYLVPPGAYAYFLRYTDEVSGRVVERAGTVVIIR